MNRVECFFEQRGGRSAPENMTDHHVAPSATVLVSGFPYRAELTPVLEIGSSLHLGGATVRIHDREGRTWVSAELPTVRGPSDEPALGQTHTRVLPVVSIEFAKPGDVVASLALADGRDVVVGTLLVRRTSAD